jgi:hypothetical protein
MIQGVKDHSRKAIDQLCGVFRDLGCIYCRSGNIVLDKNNEMIPLVNERKVRTETPAVLANYVVCPKEGSDTQPLPKNFLERAFNDETLLQSLRDIVPVIAILFHHTSANHQCHVVIPLRQ